MRPWPTPTASAAVTYSSWVTLNTVDRIRRANTGMLTIPMAIIPLSRPGPSMATIAMASKIPGKARRMSIARITTAETSVPPSGRANIPPMNKPSTPHTRAVEGLTNKAGTPPRRSPTPAKSSTRVGLPANRSSRYTAVTPSAQNRNA